MRRAKFALHFKFAMDKKALRKSLIKKRREIAFKANKDKAIAEKILALPCFKNATQVLLFASTDQEFNTRKIAEYCKANGKKVFYPRCLEEYGIMEFYKVNNGSDLSLHKYGILAPATTCEKYIEKENDVIIVPALSVDKNHYRLGYGGGYYDRFLKNFNGVSICPVYDELRVTALPTDKNDIKVSVIATDKEVIL